MIPKKIHYCWFGRNPKPESVLNYIRTWNDKMPEYEIKEWNEDNFDININNYVYEAYMAKKYAFVSDYARLFALYTEGGIYLDTDIEVLKSFDDLLYNKSFVGWEDNYLGTGVLASEKAQQWIFDIMNTYSGESFISWMGGLNNIPNPYRLNNILKNYGLKMNHNKDVLRTGIAIYPIEVLCANNNEKKEYCVTNETICIHHYSASWSHEININKIRKIKDRLKNILLKFSIKYLYK